MKTVEAENSIAFKTICTFLDTQDLIIISQTDWDIIHSRFVDDEYYKAISVTVDSSVLEDLSDME